MNNRFSQEISMEFSSSNSPITPQFIRQKTSQGYFLNLDKPAKISSAKAVAIVKAILKAKKVGHCGTLDPFATGVLPLAINGATKQASQFLGSSKKYQFTITFGENRNTQDIEGQIVETSEARPTVEALAAAMFGFIGKISQIPPQFSAISISGKRAYEMARKGLEVELRPREVEIKALTLKSFSFSQLKSGEETKLEAANFEVECSKGTYIRSICRDLCNKMQVCGFVSELRRIAVGEEFLEESAITLAQLRNFI